MENTGQTTEMSVTFGTVDFVMHTYCQWLLCAYDI